MRPFLAALLPYCLGSFALALLLTGSATAQTVWSGYTFSFTKSDFHDPTQPENQDRITDNVWITRSVQQGIYNIAVEDFYTSFSSPADTEWATQLTSPGETIAATNWEALTFDDWQTAYGSMGGLAFNIVSFPAVVHLISDNIYLDLQFTSWTQAGGGGFSYLRAEGLLPPTTTGDYNGNGVVDAADYVVWRRTLNQPAEPQGSGADGNANGTIDDGDYTFWRERFGNLVPGSGGAAALAVPEPAAAVPFLLGLLAIRMLWGRPTRNGSRNVF